VGTGNIELAPWRTPGLQESLALISHGLYFVSKQLNVPKTYKKAVLSQGNRAMPQLFLVLSLPTIFTTSLRVATLRKPGFRMAKNRI